MPQRTLSIVIEVTGAEEAERQVRRVRSAFDDLLGGSEKQLASFARRGREVSQAIREMDDLLGQILSGARGAVGNRNRVLSTLGGLGSGALTGLAFGGPVGAAIGAVVGGITGLFRGGSGREKQRDAETANRGFAQLAQILDDYNHFRRNFASAVDAAQRVWSQMQSQWVRRQSSSSQFPYFAAILRSMEQTEDERNRRRQLLALGPIPEFQGGGFVGTRGSGLGTRGGVVARLHPGEFVMSSGAVERLGVSLLEGLNTGSRIPSPESRIPVVIEPASAATLAEMLKRNPQALEEGLLVVLRRGGAASKALRG